MKSKIDKKVLVAASLVIALIAGGSFWFFGQPEPDSAADPWNKQGEMPVQKQEEIPVQKQEAVAAEKEVIKKVDVKGAVNSPGVCIAEGDDRVLDIIAKAGGFRKDADRNGVNLAQKVEDQMLIYVPAIGENNVASSIQAGGNEGAKPAGSAEGEGKININSADETKLQELTGIGPSKAKAIIQYREEKGTFASIEDLKNVAGIGDKTFEKIKDQLSI